jgi:CDGSH-type Zn-finger protein
MAVKITIKRNGPYRVEGLENVELYDADGNRYDLTGKPGISLCRCGASVNKPFCDGTHSRIGFQAAEAAVRQEQTGVTITGEPKPVENDPPASSPAKG